PCRTNASSTPRNSVPLYEEIGRLKMELDWLKKSRLNSAPSRRLFIE
ncbi:MAG: hypothetical protein, partial [Olavius algarvensis Gamma 1 endosymbiont]